VQEEIGFGIVGCGTISAQHIGAIRRTAGARLVAVWSRRIERAQAVSRTDGVDFCADLGRLLARQDVHAVSICTPSGLHPGHAIRALEAGKHVLVEKPIALTLADADQMIASARRNQRTLGVVCQYRFTPAARATKRAVEEGRFGRLVLGSASVKWFRSQAYYESGDWRGTWAMDGGALMNQSIHGIDLLQWLMGPVDSVQAYTATLGHAIEVEDVAVAALRFKSGALGLIEGTTCAYPGLTVRLEIHGTHGAAIIVDGQERLLCFGDPAVDIGMFGRRPPELDQPPSTPLPSLADNYAALLGHFVQAIREGRLPAVDGIEGRKSLALALAIYQAARGGQPTPASSPG
jgi:UDP-N-acetyl-2-amino-2-deoxyglucuronate dehydrogenase